MRVRWLVACLLAVLTVANQAVAQDVGPPGFDEEDNSFGGWLDGDEDGEAQNHDIAPSPDDDTPSMYPFERRVLVTDLFNGPGCPDGSARLATWEVRTVWGPGVDDWSLEGWEHLCDSGITAFIPWVPPGAGGAAPPPITPTDAIVHAAIRDWLPAPEPALSPHDHAITNLETWLWFEHEDPSLLTDVDHDGDPTTPPVEGMSAAASDSGYAIQATVWISEYRWELSNGTVLRSSQPGSEEEPAAAYTWRSTDPDNVVRIVARWTGTYTWSTPGSSGSGSMGSLDVVTDHAYPVMEVVAVPA